MLKPIPFVCLALLLPVRARAQAPIRPELDEEQPPEHVARPSWSGPPRTAELALRLELGAEASNVAAVSAGGQLRFAVGVESGTGAFLGHIAFAGMGTAEGVPFYQIHWGVGGEALLGRQVRLSGGLQSGWSAAPWQGEGWLTLTIGPFIACTLDIAQAGRAPVYLRADGFMDFVFDSWSPLWGGGLGVGLRL